jgi:rRNA-processing protein CGR1
LPGKHIHRGWEKQKELREKLNRVKELSRALLAEKKAAKEAARARAEENRKRKEENARKAEIVQVITNTSKIKKMKKKHLRMIQKRDTVNMVSK